MPDQGHRKWGSSSRKLDTWKASMVDYQIVGMNQIDYFEVDGDCFDAADDEAVVAEIAVAP